jgi:hypothetical protein
VPASSGSTKITPLSDLPLPPEHGRSPDCAPLLWPGGGAPSDGHGVLPLAALGGFGSGFGLGVGFGVAVAGLGVGAGVTRGVGAGVTCGLGAGVGAALGAGVGSELAPGVPGLDEGAATTRRGDADGLGSIDGEGLATDGLAVAAGWVVGPTDGDAGPCVAGALVGSVRGVGMAGGTCAMGAAEAPARCCSSAPPIPSAITARTRFRTPRLRMTRMRRMAVTEV